MHRQTSCSSRLAFTLIELLVVISILALLVALLLPALSNARRSGLEAACLTQVRGIGQAITIYDTDNGTVPPYIKNQSDRAHPGGPVFLEKLLDEGYIGEGRKTAFQRCPLVMIDLPDFAYQSYNGVGIPDNENSIYTYGMNAHIGGYLHAQSGDMYPGYNTSNYDAEYTLVPHSLSAVKDPSNTLLAAERYLPWSYYNSYFRQAAGIRFALDTGIPHIHGSAAGTWTARSVVFKGRTGTNNMSFVDGSAHPVRGTQSVDRMNPSDYDEDIIFDPFN